MYVYIYLTFCLQIHIGVQCWRRQSILIQIHIELKVLLLSSTTHFFSLRKSLVCLLNYRFFLSQSSLSPFFNLLTLFLATFQKKITLFSRVSFSSLLLLTNLHKKSQKETKSVDIHLQEKKKHTHTSIIRNPMFPN